MNLLKFKEVILLFLLTVHLPLSAQVENWAVVRKGDKEGIIDLPTGKLVAPVIYDNIQPEEYFIQVEKDGLVTLLDLTEGKEMFPLLYNYIDKISFEHLKVYRDDMVGVIDYEGKEVVPVIYKSMSYEGNGIYYLKSDSSCIIVNEDMEIISTDLKTCEESKEKYGFVRDSITDVDGNTRYLVGVKNIKTYEMVVPVKYRYIKNFQERYFIVAADVIEGTVKNYGIVNLKGE